MNIWYECQSWLLKVHVHRYRTQTSAWSNDGISICDHQKGLPVANNFYIVFAKDMYGIGENNGTFKMSFAVERTFLPTALLLTLFFLLWPQVWPIGLQASLGNLYPMQEKGQRVTTSQLSFPIFKAGFLEVYPKKAYRICFVFWFRQVFRCSLSHSIASCVMKEAQNWPSIIIGLLGLFVCQRE